MLYYAMTVLFTVSIMAVPFSLEMYAKRREPRHLYLLAYGWLVYGLSFPVYAVAEVDQEAVFIAGFGALQLLGIALIMSGALSYFIALPARSISLGVTVGGIAVFVFLFLFPSMAGLTIVGENLLLLSATVYGLSHPAKFKRIGGTSYYWLIAILCLGVVAAIAWLPTAAASPDVPEPVVPWLGTTAVVIAMVLFLVQLEYNSTLLALAERERELTLYRNDLERLVEDRTSSMREAMEARTRFLAKMSHELRTPLNSIIGFSSTLGQGFAGPMNREQQTQIEMINRSGTHLLSLIDDVLDIARIESGHNGLHLKPFDPKEMVREVAHILRPLADDKGLRLIAETPESAEMIESDPGKVKQILLNLVGNAIKFTDSGQVSIVLSDSPQGVTFEVSDTGRGIDAETLPHIFEAFTQGEQDEGKIPDGAGLGLAISQEFVTALGGEIEVTSQPGKGSTFFVRIPRILAEKIRTPRHGETPPE